MRVAAESCVARRERSGAWEMTALEAARALWLPVPFGGNTAGRGDHDPRYAFDRAGG